MARNLRNLKVSKGQRIEQQLVVERIGEHSLRNIEVMIRALLFKGTTEKAAVFEGLEVTSAGGMVVNASIPGSCVQRLDDDDLRFGFDDRACSLTLDAGGASNRRDIIEAQISRRECFLDGNVDTIDSETKVITTGSRNRDYEIIIDCRVRKGSSTTPPVSSGGTHGTLTGTVEHGSTLDMHEDYMLSFAVFEEEFTTLDFRGSTPNATTRAEVVSRFAEVGITASFDASGHLVITEGSLTGENSCFRLKDSRSSHDAFIALFGGSPLANYHNVYKGENPWFKIAEIDINSGVSVISDSNIRPLSASESWVSESNTVFVTTQIMKYITDKIDEAITGLVGGAPEALDTLNELAAALADDENYASTISTALAARYTKTEMQESGDSQMHWDNITNKPSSYAPGTHTASSHSDINGWGFSDPLMNGIAASGDSNSIARQDHVHPHDTTKITMYDYIVDSQAKFNTLVASSTWLGAKNVLFSCNVSRAAQTTIPATVQKIHGINGATITVTNLTDGQYGLGYSTRPASTDNEIHGLTVEVSGEENIYGFSFCSNLSNCTGSGTGNNDGRGYGFRNCSNLSNCTGSGTGNDDGDGYGFSFCSNLSNCTGNGTGNGSGTGYGYGFRSCSNLSNCTGRGTGNGSGTGFCDCYSLSNCIGSGTGNGSGTGYGFYDCSYTNGCRKGSVTTAVWYGTNPKRDDDSCDLT